MVTENEYHSQRHQTRPPYPHLLTSASPSSISSSLFQSSSSLASMQSANSSTNETSSTNLSASSSSYGFGAAPMPSPSAGFTGHGYFGPTSPVHTSRLSQPQTTAAQQQQSQPQPSLQPQQTSTHHTQTQAPQSFVGQRGDGRGVPVTAPFLQDFNLIAEAAKRAQMDVLTRDLGDVGL